MDKNIIVETIRKITNNTFVHGCYISTAMFYEPKYDIEGKQINANPNWIESSITIEDKTYKLIKCGWDIWIIKPEYFDVVNYCVIMFNRNHEGIMYHENLKYKN